MRRTVAVAAAAGIIVGTAGAVYVFGATRDSGIEIVQATPAPEPSPLDTTTAAPVYAESPLGRTVSASPTTTPSPTATPTPSPAPEGPSYDVVAVQGRLKELQYYLGDVDGNAGPATISAVMAFQKVNGLAVDGVVGPQTLAALDDPVTPSLRGGAATRIEVDLTKQVAYLVKGGALVRIMPISSGSGDTYTTASGGTARSLTPVGSFTIQRRIAGVREAPLGILYDPLYFYRGWALHGSNSVPAYPASHGCVRLTRSDAAWLFHQVPNGTQVLLYGGSHTFTAGSSLPGTDTPAGDTGAVAEEPTPAPTATPTRTPTSSSEPEPKPKPKPTKSSSPGNTPRPSPTESRPPRDESPEPDATRSTQSRHDADTAASPRPSASASPRE